MATGPSPETNGTHLVNGTPPEPISLDDLVAEAEALRQILVEASGRAHRLLAVLKNHKRHHRALKAAVASLRQLNLGP